jgi:hypothetical protein
MSGVELAADFPDERDLAQRPFGIVGTIVRSVPPGLAHDR